MTDWGQFWLSSTPYTQGSNDFGNFFPRICTWVLLRQIDGEQFLCFNIHLDHVQFGINKINLNRINNYHYVQEYYHILYYNLIYFSQLDEIFYYIYGK